MLKVDSIIFDLDRLLSKSLEKQGNNLFNNLEWSLDKLKAKYKLFIVSNYQTKYIEAFLKYYRVEKFFQDIICSETANESKIKNVKLLIRRNFLNSPVYVGDILGDCEIAEKSKIPFIYVEYGLRNIRKIEYRIKNLESLKELKEILI